MVNILVKSSLVRNCYRLNLKSTYCRALSTKPSYIHNIGKDPLRHITVGKLLEECAEKYGDRPAVISLHQNTRLTFEDTLQKADKLAAALLELGFKKGDRLCIWTPNIVEWYITMMATVRIGIILVPINPAFQAPELEYCINKVGIKGIISLHTFKSQNYYDMIKTVAPDIQHCKAGELNSSKVPSLKSVIVISEEKLAGAYNFKEVAEQSNFDKVQGVKNMQHLIRPDDGCNIQFTSGTTGKPKATFASHFHFVNNSYQIGKRNEQDSKHHKICMNVPLFHAYGIVISVMVGLNFGSTMVLPAPSFEPRKSLEAIQDEKCTIIHGTPTMYVDLIEEQKKQKLQINPEIALAGGAPCSPQLFHEMLDVLHVKKVKSVFGMTECTAVVFQSLPGDDEEKSTASVGHVSDHIEVKVVDAEDKVVPMGTPGELCVRGYLNMLEYWDDEQKTAEMIGRDRWLRTGDQFVLQEDGYGKIVGRLKDMIIRGGENIFPKEIEDFLNTHPSILETHVIGVSDKRLGEEVCACVRIKNGSCVSLEDVKKFCKGNLAHFKIPTKLRIVEEFPKTQSGKIQKFKLRESVEKS